MSPGITPLKVDPRRTARVTSHVTARTTRLAVGDRRTAGASAIESGVDNVTLLPTIWVCLG
jgi:hypothetical protein